MRVENHHSRNIVCGHIFDRKHIKVGQVWQGVSGATVTVTQRNADWVTYLQSNGVAHTKEAFAFQCRYCLVIGDDGIVPPELLS